MFLILPFISSCAYSPKALYFGNGKYLNENAKKQMVNPPASFITAVFNYKKRNYQWPYTLDRVCTNRECSEDYRKFIDGGIMFLKVEYTSNDTLVVPFQYSLAKHEEYVTTNYKSNLTKTFNGYYLFVKDSSFTFFKVVMNEEFQKRQRKKRNG